MSIKKYQFFPVKKAKSFTLKRLINARILFSEIFMEQKTKGLKQRVERCMYLTYTSCMIEPRQDGYEAGLHTGCLETVRELLAEH
ncbi:MAG: hypothetical protein J6K76_00405 [Spirochaetaceae bacterium]|nr:hypothetical protein [Spirochaetaceae bacterium]